MYSPRQIDPQTIKANANQRSCYAADTLEAAAFVANGTCDLPCPGDPGLFCGGTIDTSAAARKQKRGEQSLDRRAAPANILLTIYALPAAGAESSSSSISTSTTAAPVSSVSSSMSSSVSSSLSATEITTTVVTVLYTTVCATNPAYLTTTMACVTLTFHPCHCDHQELPSVEMTTIEAACSACGQHGENEVILTVPIAAISPSPSTGAGLANPAAGPQGSEAQPNALPAGNTLSQVLPAVTTGQQPAVTETKQAASGGQNTPGYVTAMGPKNSMSWFTIFTVMGICLGLL